jgi:sugar lactone lactonase YvrE
MSAITCVLDARAQLGESPVWCAQSQTLYWADLLAPAIHSFTPASGASRHWPMPETLGSFGLCEKGGAVVALRSGLYHFDFEHGQLRLINVPAGEPNAQTRFNDGKVSPDGRFFVGTMDEQQKSRPIGALYRLDPDGSSHKVLDELIVSNGLAWSPDGRTLYHADTRTHTIWAWDYSAADGSLSHKRQLVRTDSAAHGMPDGGATDMEGYYWSAGVFAGVLNRWSPDGRLDRQVAVPCQTPTMPCFGGPDMKTLYLTSLSTGLQPQALQDYPQAGGIFALKVDVPGVPIAKFGGG